MANINPLYRNANEVYAAFKANRVDELLLQLKVNRAPFSVSVRLLEDGLTEVVFIAQDGLTRIVQSPTIAQALYDACCINEALRPGETVCLPQRLVEA